MHLVKFPDTKEHDVVFFPAVDPYFTALRERRPKTRNRKFCELFFRSSCSSDNFRPVSIKKSRIKIWIVPGGRGFESRCHHSFSLVTAIQISLVSGQSQKKPWIIFCPRLYLFKPVIAPVCTGEVNFYLCSSALTLTNFRLVDLQILPCHLLLKK